MKFRDPPFSDSDPCPSIWGFCVDSGNPHSGPRACVAGTLPTEASPLPPSSRFQHSISDLTCSSLDPHHIPVTDCVQHTAEVKNHLHRGPKSYS